MKKNQEPYVYHLEHPLTGKWIATVAIQKRGKIWCRGVSCVSHLDHFCYREGRVKAIGFLEAAFSNGKSVRPFGPRDPEHKNADKTRDRNYRFLFERYYDSDSYNANPLYRQPAFRSAYDVTLTKYELNTVLGSPHSVKKEMREIISAKRS